MTQILIIIATLIFLFLGANFFIDGAVALAKRLGMSSLLVGVIIIGFGTSAPEIIVSIFAAVDGSSGIALGNAYGSNIVNIGIILGLAALISPILVHRTTLFIEMPILLGISALSFFFMANGTLTRMEAGILLLIFLLYMSYTLLQSKKSQTHMHEEKPAHLLPSWRTVLYLIGGLITLVISAKYFVSAASLLAKDLGVSDLVIGLTIVSLGTSLPELASTVMASIKRQHDMALGNIIGSNIFNTLVVVGVAGMISPIYRIDREIIYRDIPVMIAFSIFLLLFSISRKKEHRINRLEGTIFLLGYLLYLLLLFKKV
ncbi:calcium/sodium antiporter [Entomospira culicis]|uniref:Calcium/sodium antiporter n=1 Tax=Entomospira culicis TaxID=2719989 RepID=A0A968KZH5_9SPIO|nr:calcium/sodium antiporter [Entomospira culicis]NIZ19137.1 calcium/sodium antiporter [Entomospira culicis]NIZ69351.1 calcium/sodium antiporter [Entomospira culicis]WDI37964.1 calcium/sodium antiporter [Entomospira culicis]WDI39564.1 calcium/sodium antiporter [Entomospira culicis]